MKVFILWGIMFMLIAVNGQASTITLKDGRTIVGDITQQDKSKVIVNDGGSSLTYYRDEIASIKETPAKEVSAKEEPADAKDKDTEPVITNDKAKLVEQYESIFPMSDIIAAWVKRNFSAEDQQKVIAYLNKDVNSSALTELRTQGVTQYLTVEDLKAADTFFASPEGQSYLKHVLLVQNYLGVKVMPLLKQEASKAFKN